jgi:hypothetical protein
MIALNSYPGWKEWVLSRVSSALHFDDDIGGASSSPSEREFAFSPEVHRQHAVVYQYVGLQQTIEALKECEFYFRRYPFHGLPVTRAGHITNVCEMYFGRFYELKERLKNYFDAVKAVSPTHNLDIGKFIKQYEKIFDHELRERHRVHHQGRFQDLAIDRVYLVGITSTKRLEVAASLRQYRKLTAEWVGRVKRRGKQMDEILETVADATLRTCRFLALYLLATTIAEYRGVDLPGAPKVSVRGRRAKAR